MITNSKYSVYIYIVISMVVKLHDTAAGLWVTSSHPAVPWFGQGPPGLGDTEIKGGGKKTQEIGGKLTLVSFLDSISFLYRYIKLSLTIHTFGFKVSSIGVEGNTQNLRCLWAPIGTEIAASTKSTSDREVTFMFQDS